MASNLDRYRSDLSALVHLSGKMLSDLHLRHLKDQKRLNKGQEDAAKQVGGSFERDYQHWYTEARAVLSQLVPDRLQEFDQLYRGDGKRKTVDVTEGRHDKHPSLLRLRRSAR